MDFDDVVEDDEDDEADNIENIINAQVNSNEDELTVGTDKSLGHGGTSISDDVSDEDDDDDSTDNDASELETAVGRGRAGESGVGRGRAARGSGRAGESGVGRGRAAVGRGRAASRRGGITKATARYLLVNFCLILQINKSF